jgi:hypothetical protein
MRLIKFISALALCLAAGLGICRAQSTLSPTTTELDLDLRTRIAAVQGSGTRLNTTALRASTGLAPDLRFSAYGTKKYVGYAPQEAYVEKDAGMNRYQAGLIHLPFGIYDTRETYATGLIDYPMPRGDYAYNSVDWGVPGVQWSGGSSQLQFEAAGFGGRSYGTWDTQNTVRGGAIRLQTYTHGLILGVSRWDGSLQPLPGVPGMAAVHLNGLDARYTLPYLLFRGELLKGEMAGDQEMGWYLDTYYHLPGLAKWTVTSRLEQFKPGEQYPMSHQITLGARYVASPQWTLVVNWRRNNALGTYHPAWTTYAGKGGDLFFQVYRKFVY